MIEGLRALGWCIRVHSLSAQFPDPGEAALAQAERVLASLPDGARVLIDGLAFGGLRLAAHAARLKLLALLHMPLAAETGLAPEQARGRQRAESRALHSVHHIIVTGVSMRERLCAQGFDGALITVVEPGCDASVLARRRPDPVMQLLCVATLQPGKGHALLFEALASLQELPWQLTCVGSQTRSPETFAQLREQLQRLGLQQRVMLVGEQRESALSQYYRQADLFVLATRFESYGMAVAEALAHGLPVVSTRTGAIPALVGSEAGLIVGAGDRLALEQALRRVFTEPALYERLSLGAAAVRTVLPSWSRAAELLVQVLHRYA